LDAQHLKGVVMPRRRARTVSTVARAPAWCLAAAVAAMLVAPAGAPAGPWTRSAVLDHPKADSYPTAAVNRRGQAVVAWNADAMHATRVVAATGTASGRFGRAIVLSRTGTVRAAAMTDDGTAVVLWEDRGGIRAALRPAGKSFGRPQRISGTLRGQFGVPSVAADRTGNLLVAWSRLFRAGSQRVWQVHAVSRPARGAFGAVSALGTGVDPRVAFNARGDAVVSWTSVVETGGTFPVPYSRTAVAQVAMRPAGGRFGPAVTLSATPTTAVSAVVTDEGAVGAVWEHANGPETEPYGAIQTSSDAAGGAFEAAVDAPVVVVRRAFNPMIAYGSNGEIVTLWQEKTRSTPFSRAAPLHWATRMPGGTFGPRRTLTAAEALGPQLALTGDGRAVVLWIQAGLRAALYRSSVGFVPMAAPPGKPASFWARSLAAAGDRVIYAWQSDGRLLASVRGL
jgi:hypothetical protein